MTIPNVVLDEDIEPEWGNAVADAINALEAAMVSAQSGLSTILSSGWVTTARIGDGQVTLGKLASNSVDSSKIVNGSIATADIGDSQVTNAKIADGTIANAKLASGIDAAKLTTGTLPAARIGSNAITTARIADSNVTTAKIADGQVTNAKIASVPFQQASTLPIFFYRLANLVFVYVNGLTSSHTAGTGVLQAQFRPGVTVSFMLHRASDAAHRTAVVNNDGSWVIDGSLPAGSSWHGYAFWGV